MRIAGELRCLVCQNQTIADSHADLAAQDLRNQIREMLASRARATRDHRLHDRPLRRLRALPPAAQEAAPGCCGSAWRCCWAAGCWCCSWCCAGAASCRRRRSSPTWTTPHADGPLPDRPLRRAVLGPARQPWGPVREGRRVPEVPLSGDQLGAVAQADRPSPNRRRKLSSRHHRHRLDRPSVFHPQAGEAGQAGQAAGQPVR